MTDLEKEEFFNKAVGKRVRVKGWGSQEYFTPYSLTLIGRELAMIGQYTSVDTSYLSTLAFCGDDGILNIEIIPESELGAFSLNSQDPIGVKTPKTCSCDMRSLMMYGCKCGGK